MGSNVMMITSSSDTEDFPSYVTVLRTHSAYYACVMSWKSREETYQVDQTAPSSTISKSRVDAEIKAEALAKMLGLKVRP